jgi:hypothetical protein
MGAASPRRTASPQPFARKATPGIENPGDANQHLKSCGVKVRLAHRIEMRWFPAGDLDEANGRDAIRSRWSLP